MDVLLYETTVGTGPKDRLEEVRVPSVKGVDS